MDTIQRTVGRLLIAALVFVVGAASATGVMPNVQPVSVQPVGVAPGGGIQARYTYEMRLPLAAANDAGVTAAANEATYATRLVTIARTTGGGIVEGGVALGSRAIPWIAAAVTAYELYKWIRDANGNLVTAPVTVPATPCGSTGYWTGPLFTVCSFPAAQAGALAYEQGYWGPAWGWTVSSTSNQCDYTQDCTATVYFSGTNPNDNSQATANQQVVFHYGDNIGVTDPAHTTPSVAVTPDQVGQMSEGHPDWWQGMLTDPNTGAPLITPEVAQDMDALKHQIAPEYGVDPQTLTPTNPDSDYVHGNPDPRAPTALPSYCGWATASCDYYKWVEDHWPDKDPKTYTETDCKVPPQCSGDQVMCAVARNTWADKCAVSGDGSPIPDFGKHTVAEIDQGDQEVGDASKLDSSGFGWGTACPFADTSIEFNGQTITIPFQPVCDYGPWMRALILILAALKAAQIIAGLRDVAA